MDLKTIFGPTRESKILNLRQMAQKLGVSQAWLRTEADSGRVPCLRAGRSILFAPKAVLNALAKLAQEGGNDAKPE